MNIISVIEHYSQYSINNRNNIKTRKLHFAKVRE